MKKLILSLLCLGSMASAQTLLNESFEGTVFPPSGWTRAKTNPAATANWDFNTVAFSTTAISDFSINGTKSAGINYTTTPNIASLTSPVFSLVGATSPTLYFKAVVGWSYMISFDAGDLEAQISTNGTTWTTLWDEDTEPGFMDDGNGNPNDDLYNLNIVSVQRSLAPYIGQANVQIRFLYTGTDADGVSIDDVQVTATALGTSEASNRKSYSVFPIPTKGAFTVKAADKITGIRVYDTTGKLISENRNSNKGDLSGQPAGVYFLNITFADGTVKTEKLIKE